MLVPDAQPCLSCTISCFFKFQFEEIENIQAEEPFILLPELTCTSPWPVEFKSSQLQMVNMIIVCHL